MSPGRDQWLPEVNVRSLVDWTRRQPSVPFPMLTDSVAFRLLLSCFLTGRQGRAGP